MKNIFLLTFLSVFVFFSCKKSVDKIDNRKVLKDTILLKENQILFISPNDKKIIDLKKKWGNDFYTIVDDSNYYSAGAIEYLDSLHAKYISANDDAVIGYTKGSKFMQITNLKTNWYAILYKPEKYKIIDLVNFKDEYISFFNNPSNESKYDLQKWYGIYLNSDSENLKTSKSIVGKIGWYKLSIASNEISFESDERMESDFPVESPGGYFINYKCDYVVEGNRIKLYKKNTDDSSNIPKVLNSNNQEPILILFEKDNKYYGISSEISKSENLVNAARNKGKSPYLFIKN